MISSRVMNRLVQPIPHFASPNDIPLSYRSPLYNIRSFRQHSLVNLEHSERPHTDQTLLTLLRVLHLNLLPIWRGDRRLAVPRLRIAAPPTGKGTAPRRTRLIHCTVAFVRIGILVFNTVFPLPRRVERPIEPSSFESVRMKDVSVSH